MASAVLPNRSEPSWSQPTGIVAALDGGKKMGKNSKTAKNHLSTFAGRRQYQGQATAGYEVNDESAQSVSVDAASSINRRSADFSHSQYVSFDVSSRSRKDLSGLRNRLVGELDRIRQLQIRIDSGQISARSGHNVPNKKPSNKKISGNKRPPPPPSNSSKDVKRSHNSEIGESGGSMKSCALILSKLMKHKNAWIFSSPVDVMGMGLHDYYDVVKRPMDLGTVKANLGKNLYTTPIDFAEDVKLTFKNALLYNPKGHEVYDMAEQFLARFEDLFRPIYVKFEDEQRQERVNDEELPASSWTNVEPERAIKDATLPVAKNPLPASSWTEPERPKKKKKVGKKSEQARAAPNPSQSPARTQEPMRAAQVKTVKQPKPKAKDPNKREMSLEEKHKLGVGLQSLPQEKMEQVVQIISKRNGHLRHDGDEIELDIEAVDTETLWELDRFVTNWKKMVSKIKRQALMNTNGGSGSGSFEQIGEVPQIERIDVGMDTKTAKKGEAGDEDVDIDDDLPTSSYAPVEIEKDDGGGAGAVSVAVAGAGGRALSSSSSSSSSGSDSSSSSDSDSGSSSGSDSGADNAHS